VQVPALRERAGDAVLLASYFLRRFASEFKHPIRGFDPGALAAIEAHAWRGNVRELENRIKRAVIMASGPTINTVDLELEEAAEPQPSLDLREARLRAERMVLQQALVYSKSNMSQAAKLLGVSRPTLYDLIRQHGLPMDYGSMDPA